MLCLQDALPAVCRMLHHLATVQNAVCHWHTCICRLREFLQDFDKLRKGEMQPSNFT